MSLITSFSFIIICSSKIILEKDENFVNTQTKLRSNSNDCLILNVPWHYQINSYYCGPAALQMIFDYYGSNVPQEEIAEVARTYEEYDGTFTENLRRAAHFSELSYSLGLVIEGSINGYAKRKIGYVAFETNLNNTSYLRKLIDEGYPLLIITWSSPSQLGSHFRVVIGYKLNADNSIREFILNDPALGPNYYMPYQEFVDLWISHSNWTLFTCPWTIEILSPKRVRIGSNFSILAEIRYPCPEYFNNKEYIASNCIAGISLPKGFKLAPSENTTKTISNGSFQGGETTIVQWNVSSGSVNDRKKISIQVYGKISGRVPEYGILRKYSYNDNIGGIKSFRITIYGGFPVELIMIDSIIGSVIVLGIVLLFIRKRIVMNKSLD